MCAVKKTYEGHEYRSLIIVDSLYEAGTVVAARWYFDEDGQQRLIAVRVPMRITIALLTLCDRKSVWNFAEALGDQAYEDAQVDFYQELKPALVVPEASAYEPPPFLPTNSSLGKSIQVVLSSRELDSPTMQSLRDSKVFDETGRGRSSDFRIVNWNGQGPESDLPRLYTWIESNTPTHERKGFITLVDDVLQDEEGRPQIVACSRTDESVHPLGQLCLQRIEADKVLGFLTSDNSSTKHGDDDKEAYIEVQGPRIADEDCDLWRRERVVDLNLPVGFGKSDSHLIHRL